jgi:hypothetical protein
VAGRAAVTFTKDAACGGGGLFSQDCVYLHRLSIREWHGGGSVARAGRHLEAGGGFGPRRHPCDDTPGRAVSAGTCSDSSSSRCLHDHRQRALPPRGLLLLLLFSRQCARHRDHGELPALQSQCSRCCTRGGAERSCSTSDGQWPQQQRRRRQRLRRGSVWKPSISGSRRRRCRTRSPTRHCQARDHSESVLGGGS